jgi:glycerophosphoryl diester phosphodiesterase
MNKISTIDDAADPGPPRRPRIIAHRGASARERENTLAAFRLAADLGADWVELDVRRTRDDMMVVHHDAHLVDGRSLVDLDAADLPSSVPSLAEALEACGDLGVNIEIKNMPDDPDYDAQHQLSAAVAGVVRAYLPLDRALVTSFNVDSIDRLGDLDAEIPTGLLVFELGNPALAVERVVAHGHDALHPYDTFVDRSLVTRAHAAGVAVNVWTVDDPDRMTELAGMGVDGIITNVPDVACEALGGT